MSADQSSVSGRRVAVATRCPARQGDLTFSNPMESCAIGTGTHRSGGRYNENSGNTTLTAMAKLKRVSVWSCVLNASLRRSSTRAVAA